MKAVTLRNIPDKIARRIQHLSKTQGLSVNKTVLGLLDASTEIRQGEKVGAVYHDLDFLAGVWKREEAERFEKTLASKRKVEPSLWR